MTQYVKWCITTAVSVYSHTYSIISKLINYSASKDVVECVKNINVYDSFRRKATI